MFTPFQNEYPFPNFADEKPRARMQDALERAGRELGRTYAPILGGERVETEHLNASRNPARWSQVIGRVHDSTPEDADRAVQAARAAFTTWSRVPAAERARYLVKIAAILRRRIYEFSAWMVYEASKNWTEAYADTAEAVDFLEFYAREAVRWGQPHPTTSHHGEENEVRYFPLGPGVVITPWNFPLAILTGMTASAIVTGNTVVIKPAEQTPVIAAKFMELLEAASLPPGVVNFLPGPGEIPASISSPSRAAGRSACTSRSASPRRSRGSGG
jgi:1-pyrroline-5-carboxylate dehydrogenase